MWKIDDFKKIFDYLKNGEESDLNISIQANAKSELAKTEEFFQKTIDQLSFSSTHYNNFRSFLINWYSSLKTLSVVQRNITDIYGMPDTHLDEAFRSKGFNNSVKLTRYGKEINYNKGNFYYDLVNLYKRKGSPRNLLHTLRYFGLSNVEILEYMTYRRLSTNDVEFHSISSDHLGKWWSIHTDKLTYEEATAWDPHYLTSKESIIKGQNGSKLHLPTKSPYFSLRHYIELDDYTSSIATISRKIQDQYDYWNDRYDPINPNTNILDKELYIDCCSLDASILELYLSCIMIYYKYYTNEIIVDHTTSPNNEIITLGNHGKYFTCYDGTDSSYNNIVHEYEEYSEFIPKTRQEAKDKYEYFIDKFTRLANVNFLIDGNSAEDKLKVINPELHDKLINLYDISSNTTVLNELLEELSKWMKSYLSIAVPELSYLMYGTNQIKKELGPIIDFFKPYHARLLSYDVSFINNNRTNESVIVDDLPVDSIEEVIHDWDTCNSKPCCNDTCSNIVPSSFYSRATYDCGSFYDIGGACDGRENSFLTYMTDHLYEPLTCVNGFTVLDDYNNPSHEKFGIDPYVETEKILLPPEFLPPENAGEVITTVEAQSGNFASFDEGGCFDCHYANDLFMIQIIE